MNGEPFDLTPKETLVLAVSLCQSKADFARRVGCSQQVVRNWLTRDKRISVEACPFIVNAVKDPRVTLERLRPDYRGWDILRQLLTQQ